MAIGKNQRNTHKRESFAEIYFLRDDYVGGLNTNGQPTDTRTPTQKQAMKQLITELQQQYPAIRYVIGHRDTSPDLNGNGHIEPEEYIKACPCFDVRKWLKETEVMV